MTIGSFTLIKNERQWIAKHIEAWLPYLDQMVFWDGNSCDGTTEIIKEFAGKDPKIKLKTDKDPADLKDSYVEMSNNCLYDLETDMAIFLHPDMLPENPGQIKNIPEGTIAASVNIRSFAGEPCGQIFEIIQGRRPQWKNIFRLKNPGLGAHYYGHYGSWNEDVYFKEITGTQYYLFSELKNYSYPIHDTGLIIRHYSDVRPYERRLGRMKTCLLNQGYKPEEVEKTAMAHPRVSLKSGGGFLFKEIKELANVA